MPLQQRLAQVWGLFIWSVLVLMMIRGVYVLWNLALLPSPSASDLFRAFIHGLRFDMASAAWLGLPLVFGALLPWPSEGFWRWGRTALGLFLVIQIPFWVMNLVDIEFVNFVGRRMTADVVFILGEAQGKWFGFFSTYGRLILMNGLLLAIAVVGALVIFQILSNFLKARRWGWRGQTIFVLVTLISWVVMARGGWQNKPLNTVNAQVFPSSAMNLVVLNSTFTLVKSIGKKPVERLHHFETLTEMLPFLNGGNSSQSLLEGRRLRTPQNVVILILESFGREYMGEVNGLPGYTPFLDSLAKKGLFFRNGFANGRRSIEGIPAILSSVPALMNEPFVTSPFSNGAFPGLGSQLAQRGYESYFFHGGKNGTMHFDSYTASAGLQHYRGASEYPNPQDNDGVWGIYDGPMLQWMKTEMDRISQPFLVTFFSLSSHNPYLIPPKDQNRFPEGPLPILKTIAYTDWSLQNFFEEAAKSAWYMDTLFIITADHTFLSYRPEMDHEISRYRVPIIFYHPRYSWPKEIDQEQVVQQIDLLPSVLDFLDVPGLERSQNLLARSVFIPGEKSASIFVDGTSMLLMKDHFLVQSTGGKELLYEMEDPFQKRPLQDPELQMKMERRLKAALQYFGDSMLGNAWINEESRLSKDRASH